MDRRQFLSHSALAAAAWAQPAPLISSIEQTSFWENLDGSRQTWFHPRICKIPGPRPALLMTLQGITGSDYFHPVQWAESDGFGRAWSDPRPVPGMGRRQLAGGLEEGYCDTVPEYHGQTRTVIAMAHNVYYRNGKLTQPNDQRWPVYCVRDTEGRWGRVRKLEWNHPEASAIYTSNCSQRVTLPGGAILVPVSHGPAGRLDRGVTVLRCSFDGETMRVEAWGNTLRCSVGRGLLEPSLAQFGDSIYMTIRAENGQGFVTRSRDGLEWTPMVPWKFDDGESITMSTTQQRWLPHSDGLLLVYTRRDGSNAGVIRWRAPLWVSEVDPRKLTLKRATERVAMPLSADGIRDGASVEHQGNFHTTAISANESLVSTGTVVPYKWTGAVRIARIRWRTPNRLAA